MFEAYRNQHLCFGAGLGLRPPHFNEVLEFKHSVPWFEAISENFMGINGGQSRGQAFRVLEKVRSRLPVALHGVSLSIGSTDPLDYGYLEKLKELYRMIDPAWISDHLCWTGVSNENLHDLLPLPYTEEALEHLTSRILEVQEFLGRRILIENVSSYLNYTHSTLTEWEFLSELCVRADCGLLLDLNNIFVSSQNHRFDPLEYLKAIPSDRVGQIHLAGHSQEENLLIDTHDHPVCDEVWDLYRASLSIFGPVPVMIEWDAKIPTFSELLAEAKKAETIQGQSR